MEKNVVTFSTKQMVVGLGVSTTSLYDWIREGMPVLRQSPYIFTDRSLQWVIKNKPETTFSQLAQKMLEN